MSYGSYFAGLSSSSAAAVSSFFSSSTGYLSSCFSSAPSIVSFFSWFTAFESSWLFSSACLASGFSSVPIYSGDDCAFGWWEDSIWFWLSAYLPSVSASSFTFSLLSFGVYLSFPRSLLGWGSSGFLVNSVYTTNPFDSGSWACCKEVALDISNNTPSALDIASMDCWSGSSWSLLLSYRLMRIRNDPRGHASIKWFCWYMRIGLRFPKPPYSIVWGGIVKVHNLLFSWPYPRSGFLVIKVVRRHWIGFLGWLSFRPSRFWIIDL